MSTIDRRKLRPLNEHEATIIQQALERMSRSNARDAWAAKAMLDEDMHANFWWMEGTDK